MARALKEANDIWRTAKIARRKGLDEGGIMRLRLTS